jgi:cytochrome c oxidase assembly protein subunit 11
VTDPGQNSDQKQEPAPGGATIPRRHRSLAARLAFMAVCMFGFGYVLVPIYYAICAITGIGARSTQVLAAPVEMQPDMTRTITVEFVAARNEYAPWEFHPAIGSVQLHPGEIYTTSFFAQNLTDHRLVGQAIPSIAPGDGAKHLHKLECFCFKAQEFAPHEGRDMAVRFYIDPQLPSYVDRVTLSYTMFDKHEAAKGPGAGS